MLVISNVSGTPRENKEADASHLQTYQIKLYIGSSTIEGNNTHNLIGEVDFSCSGSI